jgi:hypothetical protein
MERAIEDENGENVGTDDSLHDCEPGAKENKKSCRDYTMAVAVPGGIVMNLLGMLELRAVKPEVEFWRTDGLARSATRMKGQLAVTIKGMDEFAMDFNLGTLVMLHPDALQVPTDHK